MKRALVVLTFALFTAAWLPRITEAAPSCLGDKMASHIHVGLYIIAYQKTPEIERTVDVELPKNLGIDEKCMREIHTHNESSILHIESSVPNKTFTLGDFIELFENQLTSQLKNHDGTTPVVVADGLLIRDYQNLVLRDNMTIFMFLRIQKTLPPLKK